MGMILSFSQNVVIYVCIYMYIYSTQFWKRGCACLHIHVCVLWLLHFVRFVQEFAGCVGVNFVYLTYVVMFQFLVKESTLYALWGNVCCWKLLVKNQILLINLIQIFIALGPTYGIFRTSLGANFKTVLTDP